MSPPLRLTVLDHGTTRTISPAGELDLATVGGVRAALADAFASGCETVVLDLSATTFCDSCGVHAVADAATRARHGDVRLVVLPGPPLVQQVFELCGLTEQLPFARTRGRDAEEVDGTTDSAWRSAS